MLPEEHQQEKLVPVRNRDFMRPGRSVAVAVQSVVEPHMTGIGGDCFAIYSPAAGTPVCINGSGRAPAAAKLEHYLERGLTAIANDSVDAVTIPGAVDAWCRLLGRFGRVRKRA